MTDQFSSDTFSSKDAAKRRARQKFERLKDRQRRPVTPTTSARRATTRHEIAPLSCSLVAIFGGSVTFNLDFAAFLLTMYDQKQTGALRVDAILLGKGAGGSALSYDETNFILDYTRCGPVRIFSGHRGLTVSELSRCRHPAF